MSEVKINAQNDKPDVVSLARKTDAAAKAGAPEVPVSERAGAASPTPVFDAVVREWRAKGRTIPVRHKPAVTAHTRDAA
jgi:hypothetical protein